MTPCRVGDVAIGDGGLTVIAGPCTAESAELCHDVAGALRAICADLGLGYIFKASFDKANRSAGGSERGPGMERGLAILSEVGRRHGVPTTTDVHLPAQATQVAEHVDLLQVPAFLCRQTDLLTACAGTGKPVNVKKGQFLAPEGMRHVVEKLEAAAASGILQTERGVSFGYGALVVDMPGLETLRGHGHPVCLDATHSAQKPRGIGAETGGDRGAIPALVRAGVATGIDALFLEVHPLPESAWSDRETQWPLARARELLEQAAELHDVVRRRKPLIFDSKLRPAEVDSRPR